MSKDNELPQSMFNRVDSARSPGSMHRNTGFDGRELEMVGLYMFQAEELQSRGRKVLS